jgi:hypothetical protein
VPEGEPGGALTAARARLARATPAAHAVAGMIDDVDHSLRALLCRDALAGGSSQVTFQPPDPSWAADGSSPVVDLHLYDVVEEISRRPVDLQDVREEGRVVARWPGRRWYRLSYVVTAWAERAEEEHRLLSAVLRCLVANEVIPEDCLAGSLGGLSVPVTVSVAVPRAAGTGRDHDAVLGRPSRTSLDVVVTVPLEPGTSVAVAAPPEERRIGLGRPGGPSEHRTTRRWAGRG